MSWLLVFLTASNSNITQLHMGITALLALGFWPHKCGVVFEYPKALGLIPFTMGTGHSVVHLPDGSFELLLICKSTKDRCCWPFLGYERLWLGRPPYNFYRSPWYCQVQKFVKQDFFFFKFWVMENIKDALERKRLNNLQLVKKYLLAFLLLKFKNC